MFCLALFGAGAYRVSRREQLHSQELLNQARRDALTGLPNRAASDDMLRDAIRVSRDQALEFAVLFIDLGRPTPAAESWREGIALLRALGDTLSIEAKSEPMHAACVRAGIPPLDIPGL